MKKILTIIILTCALSFMSCSQDVKLGPGYNWELFRSTPIWELAKAVKEEDIPKINEILKTTKESIDFQEPKFGRTILLLAIGNDKLLSTEALLKDGANVNIKDSSDVQAIHEACEYISLKKHSYDILKLLIKFGANINAISSDGYYVPLQGAVEDFACAKLLLDNGANPYVNQDNSYPVWNAALLITRYDGILVARYMIIDKKMKIPNPIFNSAAVKNPKDIFDLLKMANFSKSPKKQQAKDDILNYLRQIDFPKKNVYQENQSTN